MTTGPCFDAPGEPATGADRDTRAAMLAAALAAAVRGGRVHPVDALRVLRHELRRRNSNRALNIARRSCAADEVVAKYAALGLPVPKNSSPDALHADHVYALTVAQLHAYESVEEWMELLSRLREVVCVTAQENYQLEVLERAGADGPDKYVQAGIKWAEPLTPL